MIIRNWNYATHYIHRTYWCSNIYIAWNLSFCILWCSNRRVICLLVISKYWTILFFRSQIILGNSLHFWFLAKKQEIFWIYHEKARKMRENLKEHFHSLSLQITKAHCHSRTGPDQVCQKVTFSANFYQLTQSRSSRLYGPDL